MREPSWLDIFAWLTSKNEDLNFVPFQQDLLLKRQDGTGKWFLGTDEFKQWLRSEAGLLYCHGTRKLVTLIVGSFLTVVGGCGKTWLMQVQFSILIITVGSPLTAVKARCCGLSPKAPL